MFENFIGIEFFIDFEFVKLLLFSILCGVYLKFLLYVLRIERFLTSIVSLLTYILLPAITYTLTLVISSNIALSLGMVGALSIVRFRTPIKNAFDLTIFFLLISIGIVINVNPNLSFNFLIVITLIFTSIRLLFHRFEKIIDITDDNNLYLTLKSNLNNINSPVGTLIYKEFLDSIYTYRFVFKDIESTNNFLESNNKEDIIYYKIER